MSKPKRIVEQAVVRAYEKRYKPIRCYKYVLDVTWSDKSRYVIYRSLSEFKQMQMQLFEAFPIEAGEFNSSDRVIPKLGSSSLFKREEVQKAAEKRQREISQYLDDLILADLKFLEFPGLLEFFEPTVDDLAGESIQTKGGKTGIKGLFKKKKKKKKRKSGSGFSSSDDIDITGPIQLEPYIAISTFKANGRGQIGFQKDDIIEVVDKNPDGWWYISVHGEEGWGPASYLDKVQKDGSEEDEIPCLEGERYLAVKEYTAQQEDELSFTVNVVIEVLNKVLDGWWIASYDGNVGYVPSIHLKAYKNEYLDNSNLESNTEPQVNIQQAPRRQSIKTREDPSKRDLQPYRRATEKRRQRSIKQTDKSVIIDLGLSFIPIEEGDEHDDYINPSSFISTPSVDSQSDAKYFIPEQPLQPPKYIAPSPLPRAATSGALPASRSPGISVTITAPSLSSEVFPPPPSPTELHFRRESNASNDGYEFVDNLPIDDNLPPPPPYLQTPQVFPRSASAPAIIESDEVIQASKPWKPFKPPRLKNPSSPNQAHSLEELDNLKPEPRAPSPRMRLHSDKPRTPNTTSVTLQSTKIPPPPPSGSMANRLSSGCDGADYEYIPIDDIPLPQYKAPPPPSKPIDGVSMPQHKAPKPPMQERAHNYSDSPAVKQTNPISSLPVADRERGLKPQPLNCEKPTSVTKLAEKFQPNSSPKLSPKSKLSDTKTPFPRPNLKPGPPNFITTEKSTAPLFPLKVKTSDKQNQCITVDANGNSNSNNTPSPSESDGKIYEEILIKPSQLRGKSNFATRTKK